LREIAKNIRDKYIVPSERYIGEICWYRENPGDKKRKVKIVGGAYMGTYGVSNYWDFEYLHGKKERGSNYDNADWKFKHIR